EGAQYRMPGAATGPADILHRSVRGRLGTRLPSPAGPRVPCPYAARVGFRGIVADQGRVLQLLSNIVGNAIKFTPPDGEVTVSMLRRGDMILFAVADDGPGSAPEHLPHVFDRFWRKDESRGTGLGLFICKQIVETHGGEIWVESTPGSGSTFYFTLRADPGRPPAHSSTVNASSTLPGRPTNPASPDST